ncbi:uncharacterized protein LOC108226977 isoform X1 [Daucus carota subsp. sativus]|uniref:uncharacterized protein LOC108226977 isoform X1 n=1 Tax=Daucus carota subsp. sativus TaxID=79200 RepID=UPI0007B197A5|nr:PREDICTED: latent-transforming growth factor beta-binding protein 2-like isoform X2 [Daucus carota subsp. sativus]
MGSCILTISLQSTFKLVLLLLCFSYTNIVPTSSQGLPGFLQGLACGIVNCGEGTCRGSNTTALGFECDCSPGWKQIPLVSFAIPSCVLPNCTVDFQCGSGAPPISFPPPPADNSTSPCNSVFCGNGKCVVNGTSYYCQCDQGYSNLFGKSTDACFEQCYFGADCKDLGLGPAPPPSTSSAGTPKTGTEEHRDDTKGKNGASNIMKNFQALVIATIALVFIT